MYYGNLPRDEHGKRAAQRLLALRQQLDEEGPPPRNDGTLLLATWNIREFDSPSFGKRLPEAMHYIAEVCSRFDIIAIQEVRRELRALDDLVDLLGSWWKYVVTDVTEGGPGNKERLAFLFDTRKVRFGGIAGEIVVPPKRVDGPSGEKVYQPADQLYRTPYIVGFKAGWRRFMLCAVHILYGKGVANSPDRVREIEMIAQFLANRAENKQAWSNALVLLGDFNIFSRTDKTLEAITNAGFKVPKALQTVPASNVGVKGRHYDQIAFYPCKRELEPTGKAGVFDFYKSVFRDEDADEYADFMGTTYKNKDTPEKKLKYFRTYWRTHQMSDHLPMWIELKIDFTDEYLELRAQG